MDDPEEEKTLEESDGWEDLSFENVPVEPRGEEDSCDICIAEIDRPGSSVTDQKRSELPVEKRENVNEDDLPEWLQVLLEGANVPLNTDVSIDSCPEWLDKEKIRRGRKFAVENIFGLVYAEMLSLAILFSLKGSLEPLIFTGKSSTPFTAHQRYLRTVLRVCSWYKSDPWESHSEAQKQLSEVRSLHLSVAKRMNNMGPSEIAPKVTLKSQKMWCPMTEEIRKDFEASGISPAADGCPFAAISSLSRCSTQSKVIYVNQLDLSVTQFGFMGLVVLYPKKFGMFGSTDEDLEAFVHLWRALGKVLGIEDKYNFCSGSLGETRRRCTELIDKWVKPNLLDVNQEWEHMYRCLVEGIRYYVPGNTFAVSLSYLCDVLGIPTPRLYATMRWRERLLFFAHKLVYRLFMRFAVFRRYYNRMLSRALKKASNPSPEDLQRLKEKKYRYMGEDT